MEDKISQEKILYLGDLSGHCSAVSAGTPYSKRSTSRWCGGCRKIHSLWYTAEAPAFGSSPEPSSLLQGPRLQTGTEMTQLLELERSFIVPQLTRKEHKGSQESPVPARAQQRNPCPLSKGCPGLVKQPRDADPEAVLSSAAQSQPKAPTGTGSCSPSSHHEAP